MTPKCTYLALMVACDHLPVWQVAAICAIPLSVDIAVGIAIGGTVGMSMLILAAWVLDQLAS